ncbi:hypothetical protein ACWPKS_15930 [Coraliomargarita sp. W4R72]
MKRNLAENILPEVRPGDGVAGQVYQAMANASRFDSAFYNEALHNYAVGGWDTDPLQELLEFLAPGVTTPEMFTYKAGNHADYFQRLEGDEDVRPLGGDFGRLDGAKMEDVSERLDEKGLVIVVDRREIEADPDAEEKAIDRVRRILLRTEIRRAFGLLDAASTNAGRIYSSTTDPDQFVSSDLLTSRETSGVDMNNVFYGSTAWQLRQQAYRAQNNAGGYASAAMNPQQLADFLGVNALAFRESLYRGSSGLSPYLGSKVLMFNAASGLGKDDPSNIKRFKALTDGADVMVYRQEFARKVEITVAHKSKIKITSTLGLRKQTVTAS